MPHSRNNDISREQLEAANFKILVDSPDGGVHMAVSPDQFRIVYLQGHPEYDRNSLLKEYKREIMRYIARERTDFPPSPENYFNPVVEGIIEKYRKTLLTAMEKGAEPPEFPENEIEPQLDNTWSDTGKAIFNNWLGLVYKLTNLDRKIPFREGIDPANPLGLR